MTSMTIKKVFNVEGLEHKIFSINHFCDNVFDVNFFVKGCVIIDSDEIENFNDINKFVSTNFVIGLPELRFDNDSSCSACEMGTMTKNDKEDGMNQGQDPTCQHPNQTDPNAPDIDISIRCNHRQRVIISNHHEHHREQCSNCKHPHPELVPQRKSADQHKNYR
ncbi:hypothetical protein Ccrd_025568 [Cynara cardunculus var. scolymus]|uniref:Uncharacterized protein n=1 Tax=Cynara cardunculus var. scolymus TaxID=59895 RepID=A0A103WLB8_CYNCS|nr:hypothetical protein Ccrd_025568 [Cynara cardunculus var. scolymus]